VVKVSRRNKTRMSLVLSAARGAGVAAPFRGVNVVTVDVR
jgi:hypothetical protein